MAWTSETAFVNEIKWAVLETNGDIRFGKQPSGWLGLEAPRGLVIARGGRRRSPVTPAQWITGPLIALVGSVFLLSRSSAPQAAVGESPGGAPEDSDTARDAQGTTARP